jgi:Domain of unknown function (DUF4265)
MNTESDPNIGLEKIRVVLPADAWHKVESEWLWGKHVEGSIYVLRNTPFYALGLSYNDRVKVGDTEGYLKMLGVVSRGGHSTYRIFAKKGYDDPQIKALLKKLNDLQCGIEGATKKLVAVDVLPEADIHKVYAVLQKAEQTGIIDFEEGHCGHPLGSKPQ